MGESEQEHATIFLGPSLPVEQAKPLLPEATFRGPIKRGDLQAFNAGAVVGIIDGVFAQTLAISPGEVRDAIRRGVIVYGAASMGALRAAEVESVVGIGRIFEMYRAGIIERDDEVAVLLNPDTHEALTEALVNVRFSVERLVRSGTLSRTDGDAIVEACAGLHYTQRTYRNIIRHSKLANNKDADDIIQLLKSFDLKRNDAQLLLETIAAAKRPCPAPMQPAPMQPPTSQAASLRRASLRESSDAPLLVWESGDCVSYVELVRFLKVTGRFEAFARNVIGRFAAGRTRMLPANAQGIDRDEVAGNVQALLDGTRLEWGWASGEEAHVSMADLGLGLRDLTDALEAEVRLRQCIRLLATAPSEEFDKAFRAELWLNELSLKREVLRLGSLKAFAREGQSQGQVEDGERQEARRAIARLRREFRWGVVSSTLEAIGVTQAEQDSVIDEIALARKAARPVIEVLDRRACPAKLESPADRWRGLGMELCRSPKALNSARFSISEQEAAGKIEIISKNIGIRRIGLVGELDILGIYIAQAFGERRGWSASFSSGKAESRDGARVGSIMEEVEIQAQIACAPANMIRTSYATGCKTWTLADPRELGLPYDSRYTEDLEMNWAPCLDLVSCRTVYVPAAALLSQQQPNDIFYCPRLGGKIFSSNGLGSGFSLAEAIVHAGAEYIERHAYRLAELELDNPGQVGVRQFHFVDDRSLPETPARIVKKYKDAGMCVRILDITSEVKVPAFHTRVFDDLFETDRSSYADGTACHPDPEVAIAMALLESGQTRGGYIAGAREDFSLRARSLGRHERPSTATPRSRAFWFGNDRPVRPFEEIRGFRSRDILEELVWIVDRVRDAGAGMFLVADYSIDRIRPAYAVRVLIPGLETTNPLFTGRRARATIIRDLLGAGM